MISDRFLKDFLNVSFYLNRCLEARMVKDKKKSVGRTIKSSRKEVEGVYAKTQNVVVSASVNRELPLERLATKLERAEYNPEQFPGLILKMDVPVKASALLFSSGKIVITGTKSEKEIIESVYILRDKLKKGGELQ